MSSGQQITQTTQRIRVGMIGLAAVVLLIGLASAIVGSLSRDRSPAASAAKAQVVANMTMGNAAAPLSPGEPLAELGVAPSTGNIVTP